jgi:hypothetical protein
VLEYSRTPSPRRVSAAPSGLTILADPNAAGFYERNGAVRLGEAHSGAVPGRLLPLYDSSGSFRGGPS